MDALSSLRFCAWTALVLGAIACAAAPLAGIRAPKPSGTATEAWNRIHLQAVEDLNCRLEELSTKTLVAGDEERGTKQSFQITGCGETEVFFVWSRATGGWAFFSDMDLRRQLKFAYGNACPNLSVEFIDSTSRGVHACDQNIIFVRSGNGGWISNLVTKEAKKAD
jgi:hypothetical protein